MTATELRKQVQAELETEQAAIKRHDMIAEALKDQEGKKITRRFNNRLSAIGMEIAERFGSIYAVPANRTMWNAQFSHQIGRDVDGGNVYSREQFEHMDACQGSAARERVAERTAWLAGSEPEQVAQRVSALVEEIGKFAAAPFGPGRYIAQGAVKAILEDKHLWRIS
jgi:hypothetical protein